MADFDQQNNDSGSDDPLREDEYAFLFQKNSDYTIARRKELDPSLTDDEARREVVEMLADCNIMVNTARINKEEMLEFFGELPAFFVQAAFHAGMIWVYAFNNGTTQCSPIEFGADVCFDVITGKCVTGIRPEWGRDDYKLVGKAWKAHTAIGVEKIPVTLHTPRNNDLVQAVSVAWKIREIGPPIVGTITHRPAGMAVVPEEITGTIQLRNPWGLALEIDLDGAATYVDDDETGERYYHIDRLVCVTVSG